MARMIRHLPVLLLVAWSGWILAREVVRLPDGWGVLWCTHPSVAEQRHGDPALGAFQRFIDRVRPLLGERERVLLVGPAAAEWAGRREDHWKCLRYRLLPRPVRAVRGLAPTPEEIEWADWILLYDAPVLPVGFPDHVLRLDLGPERRVFERRARRP